MKRVEQYIKDYTRNCSNEIGYCHNKTRNHNHVFYPWLTPTHAECIAKIAREETIKEVCEWLDNNVFRYVDREEEIGFPMYYTTECIEDLKKHLEDKV